MRRYVRIPLSISITLTAACGAAPYEVTVAEPAAVHIAAPAPAPEPVAAPPHPPVAVRSAYVWQPESSGRVPLDAPAVGREQPPGGEPLWACRARYAHPGKPPGLHLGKVAPHLHGCSIEYGGQEIGVPTYEVLTGTARWIPASNGAVPQRAARVGVEGSADGGEPLYLCRATYPPGTTGIHVGKVRPGFAGCNIGWGGSGVVVPSYEVAAE